MLAVYFRYLSGKEENIEQYGRTKKTDNGRKKGTAAFAAGPGTYDSHGG
jgi:hypothetical protein